jgi:hypothetical protein
MRRIVLLVVASLALATCGGGGGSMDAGTGGSAGTGGGAAGTGGGAGTSGGSGPGGLCQQIGTALCAKACSCREGAECAMSQEGLTLSFDSESDCLGFFVTLGCSMGDAAAYNDAAACLPLAQAAPCAGTGTQGAVAIPTQAACQSPP